MDEVTNDRSGDFLSVYSSSDDNKGPSLGPGWFSSQPASDDEPQGTSNAGSHELDSSAQTLKLTVIEQNAPRDYIRIAMAFPCPRTSYFEHQFQEIYDAVLRAFCRTVEHWPFLAGRFKISDTTSDEKITLVYSKVVDKQSLTHLLTLVEPPSNGMPKAAREEMYTARLGIFKKERFSMKHHDPENHEPFPPVKTTISLAGGMLVLGFSLSEVIFDALSIQNFFRKFLESTNQCIRGPEHQAVLERVIPEAVNCDPDDKYELPCWDWKSTETEEPTPREELRCRVFTLNAVLLQDLRRMVRERTMASKVQTYPLIEDCVLGLFWVAIMRCRAEYKMIEPDDSVRANILVSGSQCCAKPRSHQPDYFGNSTVAAVAQCKAEDLIGDLETLVTKNIGFSSSKRLARAAQLIRRARREINTAHMSKLCGIKQAINPAEDRLAYDRALKRHTDSLCFEDWTCYGAQYEGYLPFVEDTQPTFFPCQDQVNEGTVILLPRKNEREGDEDWHIFVCLDEQDLAELELILEDEGWWQPPTADCKEPAKK